VKCFLAFGVVVMFSAGSTSTAQTKAPAAPEAPPLPFHYVVAVVQIDASTSPSSECCVPEATACRPV
jgi:hypothetical protein